MAIKRYLDESGLTLVWGKITGLTSAIDGKVNTLSGSVENNYYTSAATESKIAEAVERIKSDMASVFNFKGTVATFEALPSSGNTTGDVWHVTTVSGTKTNAEYVWNGKAWEELGTTVDLSGYQENLSWTVTGEGNTVVSIAQSGADNQEITVTKGYMVGTVAESGAGNVLKSVSQTNGRVAIAKGYAVEKVSTGVTAGNAFVSAEVSNDTLNLTKGYLVSSVTEDGAGNAVTSAAVADGVLTLTKGKKFSEDGHKHVAANITDFNTSVDARIKLESVKVNGTALSIAADKSVDVLVAEGATNGTIAVNGTDVAVHGLRSAAFTEASAYATAAQGAKADTALQPADIDAIEEATINNICK